VLMRFERIVHTDFIGRITGKTDGLQQESHFELQSRD
jgi:hypothetical protein